MAEDVVGERFVARLRAGGAAPDSQAGGPLGIGRFQPGHHSVEIEQDHGRIVLQVINDTVRLVGTISNCGGGWQEDSDRWTRA
jgi:hypothetical protein